MVAVNPDGTFASVVIQQEPPSAPEGVAQTLRSHRIGLGLYDLTDAGLVRRERLELDVVGAETNVPQLVGVSQPDLLLVNDGDLTFAKIRLDERSWKTATEHLGALVDPLSRTLIWSAAWDMTRDAEVTTGDFLSLVLSGIGRETDIAVVQGVLRQAKAAIDQYAAPEHQSDYNTRLATALRGHAEAAAAGSDHQLAFARAFAGTATTDAQLDVVAGLLDGSVVWTDLAIDTDLRWYLMQRLVAAGRLEDDAIESELRRDDTATGRRHAALARAARPSAVAKEQAWAEIVDRVDLPNAVLDATIAGFMQPNQVDELRPFRDRYFADLPRVWQQRTMEMAQDITVGLFPLFLVDEQTVAATDAFLGGELNSALRRLVSEGRDGLLRALRARAKDA
jgi:aminopeptidase N